MTTEEQQKKDEQFMLKALDEARKAKEKGEIPIGAVIACKDHRSRQYVSAGNACLLSLQISPFSPTYAN